MRPADSCGERAPDGTGVFSSVIIDSLLLDRERNVGGGVVTFGRFLGLFVIEIVARAQYDYDV